MVTTKRKSTIINEHSAKPKSDKSTHYVDNERFLKELLIWQAEAEIAKRENKPQPIIPNYIGECIMKICKRLSDTHYFRGYTYVDELVLNAIENCIKKLKNFDITKSPNPFSYFTQIAYFNFINTIDTEKEEAYVKYKSIMERLTSSDLANSPEDSSAVHEHAMDNVELQVDHLEEYIKTFEDRKKAKKSASKKSKLIKDVFE